MTAHPATRVPEPATSRAIFTRFWSVPWAAVGPLAAGGVLLECEAARLGVALNRETIRVRRDVDCGPALCPSAERYVVAGLPA